jgi:hypothetical protein
MEEIIIFVEGNRFHIELNAGEWGKYTREVEETIIF